jgi:signal transduction histidine kinase
MGSLGRWLCGWLLLVALALPSGVSAQALPVHDLSVLVDAEGTETIDSVSARAAEARFVPIRGGLAAGYTRKVHWLRFSVQAPTPGAWWLDVMPPYLDDLRLFEPGATGFTERRAGDHLPFASREESYAGFIFKLSLPDAVARTYYLRLQTSSTSLAVVRLWQPTQFYASQTIGYGVLGAMYSLLGVILLLNLALWGWSRESIYGWFSLYVVTNIFLTLNINGLLAQYLLTGSPLLASDLTGLSLFLFLSITAAFYRRMLCIERGQNFYFGLFRAMALLPCMLIPSILSGHFTEAARLAVGCSVLVVVLILQPSVRLFRQGRSESIFLVLASGLTLLGSTSAALMLLGYLPVGMAAIHFQQQATVFGVTAAMQIALAMRRVTALREQREAVVRVNLDHITEQHERGALEQLVQSLTEKNELLKNVDEKRVALQQNEATLQATASLLAATIESMAQGLLVIGSDQRVRLFNSKFCEMLVLPRSFLESKPLFSQLCRYQIDRGDFEPDQSTLPPHAMVLTDGNFIEGDTPQSTRYVRKTLDGRSLEVQTYRMPSGDAVRTFSDVTEFSAAQDAAEAANRAKSRFLATMSHEIRTPLNGVLGMAQVLLLPGIGERERVDYARTIVSSGQTLLTLLNSILDLSRVEAGNLQLESCAVEPLALIDQTRAVFSAQARSAGLTIECQWTGAPDACYLGDPLRLSQMLANLLGNAIKFTRQGHIRIDAGEIGSDAHGALIEFAVCDTGVGIAPDKLSLLYQSFSQADTSITRQYGGSGLGLSIVRNLAELMGGGVGAHSTPGQGSRFWFHVRLAHVPAGAQRPPPFQGRVLAAQTAQDLAPVPEDKPVDVAHVRTLLAEILPLLAHSKFASIACFRQLQEALAGTELADDMAQTGRLLQDFRFDLVQQRLRQLAAEQGWEINRHD